MTSPLAPASGPAKALRQSSSLGDSSMVEQRTLTPLILVRIQVPQPAKLLILLYFVSFWLRRNWSDISDGYWPPIMMVVLLETQNRGLRRAKARGVSAALFRPVRCRAFLGGSTRRQASANPRSRRCFRQSCGRFLESATSRVGVSSIGCWPTRIARTISGERYERRTSTAT